MPDPLAAALIEIARAIDRLADVHAVVHRLDPVGTDQGEPPTPERQEQPDSPPPEPPEAYAPLERDPGRLATTAEVADYLNTTTATVHQWLYKGIAPKSYKVGKHRRFQWADVDAWLETKADDPTAP